MEEVLQDGSTFKGFFINGKKCGQGSFKFKDGSILTGEFQNDVING